MKIRFVLAAVCAVIAFTSLSSRAQDVAASGAPVSTTTASAVVAPVPHYVRYSGAVTETGSKPQQMRFSLYENQVGGQPVWSEIQTVTPVEGKYAVLLGAGTEAGLPQNVFSAAQARWLGITVGAGQEQPRTILLATPYALESSDAQTLAGHPATDFVLAGANGAAGNGTSGTSKAKPNTATDISQIDVTTGLTITNGGTGPTVTMGVDATKIPFLATANSFGGTQTITSGNLGIQETTSKTSGAITVGGTPIFQTYSAVNGANNLFVGLSAGNFSNLGKNDTAVGAGAMASVTTATGNVGLGNSTLVKTNTGNNNTAVGAFAGYYNIKGNNNTYVGNSAGPALGNGNFSNSAAIGANAVVGESNAMVLGGTGANAVSVGIGTATPQYTLDVQGTANFTGAINYTGVQTITGSLDSGTNGMLTATNNEANCPDECVGVWGIAGVANDDQVGVVGYGYFGIYGYGGTYGVFGDGSQYGVFGNGDTGVEGYGDTTGVYASGSMYGVYASGVNYGTYSVSSAGGTVGVFGDYFNLSNEYTTFATNYAGTGEGIWGDGGGTGSGGQGIGVVGTSDTSYAIVAATSYSDAALLARSDWDTTNGTGYMFQAYSSSTGDQCTIDTSSNVVCDGGFNPAVVGVDKRHIETYATESSENWIDDYGSGQLQNGRAVVAIHSDFANITNTGVEYHVFLTPKGESENLYVVNETSTGFEVREAHNGGSNVAFDYRIVAKRLGSESGRLVDITAQRNSQALAMKVPAGKRVMKRPGGLVMPAAPKHMVKRATVAVNNSNSKH